jgi:hypothetical protein
MAGSCSITRSSRRWNLLVAGVIAAVLIPPFIALVKPLIANWTPKANVPLDRQIAGMRAELYRSQAGFEPIEAFDVPPDQIPLILFWFRPSDYVKHPPVAPDDIPVGKLSITTHRGETRFITFYAAGLNPPVFTENGTDYFFGGGITDEDGHGVDGGVRAGKAVQQAYAEAKQKLKG